MPVVFVHGVATRQTPAYQEEVKQRDQLFQRLVLGDDDRCILDPDWGSNGVKLVHEGVWLPTNDGRYEPFAGGAPVLPLGGASVAAAIGDKNQTLAIDLAFAALLAQKAKAQSAEAVDVREAGLSQDELDAFEQAVNYLKSPFAQSPFQAGVSDAVFADTLSTTLRASAQLSAEQPARQAEAYGLVGGVADAIGSAVKAVTDPFRNVASDAVLAFLRKPLSNGVALFLGDVFVYLRGRANSTADGATNRIFQPIMEDLIKAAQSQTEGQKLIVVGHSLGGVILYDLLTDPVCLARMESAVGKPIHIDNLFTVGSQPGLFADMNLYPERLQDMGKLPKPSCVGSWVNVFDFTDVFSFTAEPFFDGVTDAEFDNVSGVLNAHTAYFQRPSFYTRLKIRLASGDDKVAGENA